MLDDIGAVCRNSGLAKELPGHQQGNTKSYSGNHFTIKHTAQSVTYEINKFTFKVNQAQLQISKIIDGLKSGKPVV